MRFAALSLLSLCMFPFLARHVAGPVLGLKFDEDEIERLIAHTARLFAVGTAPAATSDASGAPSMNLRAVLSFRGCLALAACGNSAYDGQILGTLERDRLELVAESNEPIVEISVREGDAVQAGATLLRQELGSMQARLDQAVAARNVAERRLAELVKGPRAQEITEARAALESARSMLETETNEYQRVQDLVSRKLLSQSALDQQRARRDSAAGTNKQAAARLNLLLEGTRVEEVEQAEAALKQAQAALVEVQTSAARYVVKAPRAGRIEAIPYKLGERPAAGAPLIVMLADGTPYARVYVPEPLRTKFLPGHAHRTCTSTVATAS